MPRNKWKAAESLAALAAVLLVVGSVTLHLGIGCGMAAIGRNRGGLAFGWDDF